jgi:uncharacterized protein (TIGR02117 family)
MKQMKACIFKSLHILKYVVLSMLLFILVYVVAALILSNVSVNDQPQSINNGVDIYILSNGVHTDLVLPSKKDSINWTKLLIEDDPSLANDSLTQWIAFGWGGKGFYLETPTWNDLTVRTASKAAFGLSSTAMHICRYKSLTENDRCKKITVSSEDYQKLVTYIENSFQKDIYGAFICIPGKHYSTNDSFFEAKGKYSLFKTCNTWTNTGLKIAGARACVWTPLDKGIFWQY